MAADQEQQPKKRPELKTIEATYSFQKHDAEEGGVHNFKAKAVDETGRVVIDANVTHDRVDGIDSDDDGYWLQVSQAVMNSLLKQQGGESDTADGGAPIDDDDGLESGSWMRDRTEEVEQELFDTLILDRTLRPSEQLGPFFQGLESVGDPTLTNSLVPGVLDAHNDVTVRYVEIHIDGDLTDEERRQFVQGTALTIGIGDKPYRLGPLRLIDAEDKIRTWTGPLGVDCQGLLVPARQAFCVRHDHSAAARDLLPKLRLFRCVAKVKFVRDVQ